MVHASVKGDRAVLGSVRRLSGSLVFLPVVVLFFGSEWSWERESRVSEALLLRDIASVELDPLSGTEVGLWRRGEGERWTEATVLPESGALELRLDGVASELGIEIQADGNDTYTLSTSSDGTVFREIWIVPKVASAGLSTRRSPQLILDEPARILRVTPLEGDGMYSVSWLRVTREPTTLRHWWLLPLVWGIWLLAILVGWHRGWRARSERLLAWWERADLWISGSLIFLVLFRLPPALMGVVISLAVIFVAVAAVRRMHPFAALGVMGMVLFVAVAVPRMITRAVVSRVAEIHELTVDHRLLPSRKNKVNIDGVRFDGTASDLNEEDFVVAFLGDSFTFGLRLRYEATYPYQFEAWVNARSDLAPVRAVNFGWASSSPLLSLRLLTDVGQEYKPDLIVYNLDVTDFHDDLRYENELLSGAGGSSESAIMKRFLELYAPAMNVNAVGLGEFLDLIRVVHARGLRSTSERNDRMVPADRFFVTNKPLDETRPHIERGVMKNLLAMHEFAVDTLHCPMVVVIFPRAYQYTRRESPDNWEAASYTPLGPYVREPFAYFEQVGDSLPYPVISALQTFESARVFPLFLRDDPHWNAAGARLAARFVGEALMERGLLPARHGP